jgi:DNA-binding CsgD family transcriptional regulator
MKIILSEREVEILKLIISEYTTSEIAAKLSLSRETVKTHRRHLLFKCSARNVAGLVSRAYETGLIASF